MYLFLNFCHKRGLRQLKRFNKHWFLKIISQTRCGKHTTCFLFFFLFLFLTNKNFIVEAIPAIVFVCWCPQTQLVFKFLKSGFFLKIHTVPIYFEIERNQPLLGTGDPLDVPAAFAEPLRRAPTPFPPRKDVAGAGKLLGLHREMLGLRRPRHWEC